MDEKKKPGRRVMRITITRTRKTPVGMLRIILKSNKRTFKYLSKR